MEVPRVAVSVDLVILTVRADQLSVLAWRRHAEPHLGRWALPGGFIRLDEDLPATAARVLAERAGLPDALVHLEQLQTYGYPDRDPRQRVVSVAYLGLAPDLPAPDQQRMSWQPVAQLAEMAFDHLHILRDGVERARAKLEYTTLGAAFCRDTFTVAELRRVYQIVGRPPGSAVPARRHRRPASAYAQAEAATGLRAGKAVAGRAGRRAGGPESAQVVRRRARQVYCRHRCRRAELISPGGRRCPCRRHGSDRYLSSSRRTSRASRPRPVPARPTSSRPTSLRSARCPRSSRSSPRPRARSTGILTTARPSLPRPSPPGTTFRRRI